MKSTHPYIVRSALISSGTPVIAGTRTRVIDIAIEYEKLGFSPDQIIDAHPHLRLEQVHDALSYYYENIGWFRNKMRSEKAAIKKIMKNFPSIIKKISMKNLISSILTFTILFSAFKVGEEKNEPIAIGAEAPKTDLKMTDISGSQFSLSDIKKENGLLVIFSCNTCPFVINWEDRYPGLADICEKNNIGMVLVNSNEAKRNGDDSLEEMKKHAAEKNYKSHYVVDANSELANAFGAKTTPHVFLFDKNLKLVYRGSIDDTEGKKDKQPKEHYLINAIVNMTAGNTIVPNDTKAIGCSIKRAKSADCSGTNN